MRRTRVVFLRLSGLRSQVLYKFMKLIDTHAHIDSIEDIDDALMRAHLAGVLAVVAVGEDLKSNQRNLSVSRLVKQPEILLSLGIHPGKIITGFIEEEFKFIEEHIAEAKAIGEIGLDFWYKWVRKDQAKKDEQRQVYTRLLSLAKEHNMPALIHTRGAWREAFEIVKDVGVKKAVFHWYSGPTDVLKDILDEGYFVSASPSIAYSPEARSAMEIAPVEKTLIETDSPVFYKQCEGGLKAEPKDVFVTLKHYARLKKRDEHELAEVLNRNAKEFFGVS